MLRNKAIAFCSLGLGFGASGCYDGRTAIDGGTDSNGGGMADGGSDGSGSGGAVEDPPENAALVPESLSHRLSQAELDNTLTDLLGESTRPARIFLTEDEFAPYDNDYSLQLVSQTLIESMEVLSIDVAGRLVADPTRRADVVPCQPSGASDTVCFQDFVETFGRLTLRRPLSADEVSAYMTLQEYSTESIPEVDNDFYTGVALVVSAMLQDPEFLYRIEAGTQTPEDGVYKLNDYEIAAKISYLLWGSTPDTQLIADAEAGMLADPEGRSAAVDRVLSSDKAKSHLYRYHAMWLGYRGIPHPQMLVDAFSRETTALIERVVFGDASSYTELFSLTETYLDTFLADHYGLPQPAGGEAWVAYDDGRAGILSHGSVLAAFSKFTDTSPTQRGIFISERLLCLEIPTPPPTVSADNPPGNPDDPTACKEARYAVHAETESCNSCHKLMDPIGLGLENYDIAGRYREADDGKPDCIIVGEGALPGVGTFSGPGELSARLVQSGGLERCVTQQYMQFALGRALGPGDSEVVNNAFDGFETNNFDFKRMMADYASADAFGFRREPGT